MEEKQNKHSSPNLRIWQKLYARVLSLFRLTNSFPKYPLRSFFLLFVFLLSGLLFSHSAFAADNTNSLILTLTTPLFQITQSPGSEWTSSLRLVNSNHYDIVVSVKVQDFHPDGETGNAVLEDKPKAQPTDTAHMSGWIETNANSIYVKQNTTAYIPFTIHVPQNADPGGHYAAILVGTSPSDIKGGSGAGVGSAVSSLVFLRVPGDVVEKGDIRDFYANDGFVQTMDNSFVLRFENKGNVHLVPQGEIIITNMWGKERGKIAINEENTFGNVLPNSTRKFQFSWKGEPNPFEIGRYKAVATLAYGGDARQMASRAAYFWVIPLKPVFGILLGLICFGWFISWSIRRYIRKALNLEREYLAQHDDVHVDKHPQAAHHAKAEKGSHSVAHVAHAARAVKHKRAPEVTLQVLRRPLIQGALDLGRLESHGKYLSKATSGKLRNKSKITLYIEWGKRYRLFILFIFVVSLGLSLIGWYFVEVFQSERAYQVEQVRDK